MKLSLTEPVFLEAFRDILETLTGDACAVHLFCFLSSCCLIKDTALDFMSHPTVAAHRFHILVGSEEVPVKRVIAGMINGRLKFLTPRKILPLLDLLAKFKRVLACSCSPNFCVARKLAKQIFYFCSCSQKNRSARHARKDHSSPLIAFLMKCLVSLEFDIK